MGCDLKRCSRCVTPETHESIVYNSAGVCGVCTQQDLKHERVDWKQKKKDLDALVEQYRGKYDYDCIVPFSGGKDSTFTLYYLMKEYKLKPLVVRFNHGFMRGGVQENVIKALRNLGADFHDFTANWKVVRKLMLQAFLEKGDFCWHCHTGIFAYPMQVAVRSNIPLLFWGEPSAEYTSYYSYDQPEEVDEKRFNRFINLGINADDMYLRLEGEIDERDLNPFRYPKLKDLRGLNYRSVCLGSYVAWDVKAQMEVIKNELGWEGDEVENVPPGYDYEKIECYMQGVRDYIKFIKRGYTRPTHLASIDIRNQRMTREEAMAMIKQYEGYRPPSLDLFLEFMGLSEEEFLRIAMSHQVSPYVHDPKAMKPGKKTHDYAQWVRAGALPREETVRQVSRLNPDFLKK